MKNNNFIVYDFSDMFNRYLYIVFSFVILI